jgi:ATP-dependent RNA helicase DDX10/DBP4
MKNKSVFQLDKLPIERFAESLGLPGAPKVKFVTKEIHRKRKEDGRKSSKASKREPKDADANSSEEDNSSDSEPEAGSSTEQPEPGPSTQVKVCRSETKCIERNQTQTQCRSGRNTIECLKERTGVS